MRNPLLALSPGDRLGPYEIVAPLGAGGMGEVYRGRDTRLERSVAVKVLPQHLSSSPEVRARFEREAKTISSLNHPNICTLFDVGREGGIDYLVMELVEGETLADRLSRGALPIVDVLRWGAQIAEALDRAHRAGVVHRDLKPGNVMIAKSGMKLMDFGLARETGLTKADRAAPTQSPTMAQPLTAEGTILGTFQYMAPEQLEGKDSDARADLWALGCVLYEMATGQHAFEGDSQASLIGSIMKDTPRPISDRIPMSPTALDRLVNALLAKDPADRVQTAHDVGLQLRWIAEPSGATPVVAPAKRRGAPAWLGWAVAGAVALASVAAIAILRRRPETRPSIEFTLEPPAGFTFTLPADPAISPDGRTIACVVSDPTGSTHLAIRPLDRAEVRVLPGTESASLPFWSPDSRSLGFFAKGKLWRMVLDGSAPVALADANDGRGGTWSKEGTIVFAPAASGSLYRIATSGGEPVEVTKLDPARGEMGHRYPRLLRDGRRFLYISLGRDGKKWLCAGDIEGGPVRVLRQAENSAQPSVDGWSLTVEKGRVLAQRLDERSLELAGNPIEVAPCGSWGKIGHANLGSSVDGTLVYQSPRRQKAWLRWYDPAGKPIGERTRELDSPLEVALAPDERKVAIVFAEDNSLWLLDLDHPVPSRLTFFDVSQLGGLYALAWSPDSKRIAYSIEAGTINDVIHVYSLESAQDSILLPAPGLFAQPQSWSADGRTLVATFTDGTGGQDSWTIPVGQPSAAAVYEVTKDYELRCAISPDDHWLASVVESAGKPHVRIQSYPKAGTRFELALDFDIATLVFWGGSDGRTLVLVDSKNRVLAVEVRLDGGFRQDEPRVLFTLPQDSGLIAVKRDLRQFLVLEGEHLTNPAPLRVITAWPDRIAQ